MRPTPIKHRIAGLVRSLILGDISRAAAHHGRRRDAGQRGRPGIGQDALQRRLLRYEEELRRLRMENEHLRFSATTFGELAERLNTALRTSRGYGRTRIAGEN
jgi:hypothetical protein